MTDHVSTAPVLRPPIDQQLAVGAIAQALLLGALAAGVGLDALGWLAGAGYAAGLWALLGSAARRAGRAALGPADAVTLARAVLVGGVTALVADGLATGDPQTATLVVLAAVALALDGVDGQVARRSGTVSALGARFDMEVDSVLVLVLSVHVAVLVGPWVLLIGLMRYLFAAASRVAPWLRSPLPARCSTKAVAALQGIALVAAASTVLPAAAAAVLLATALALLVWSFGRDVVALRRAAHRDPEVPRLPIQTRRRPVCAAPVARTRR